jgi:hypothetical protein
MHILNRKTKSFFSLCYLTFCLCKQTYLQLSSAPLKYHYGQSPPHGLKKSTTLQTTRRACPGIGKVKYSSSRNTVPKRIPEVGAVLAMMNSDVLLQHCPHIWNALQKFTSPGCDTSLLYMTNNHTYNYRKEETVPARHLLHNDFSTGNQYVHLFQYTLQRSNQPAIKMNGPSSELLIMASGNWITEGIGTCRLRYQTSTARIILKTEVQLNSPILLDRNWALEMGQRE